MITAPYNFVPLNKEVFYPSWDKEISHDIPFEDGESGMIKVDITAESPIFIRNHYEYSDEYYETRQEKKVIKVSKEFCHMKLPDGGRQYYIPSTSLKGMIRNIMEIMSFATIRIDKNKHENILSVRDMTQDNNTGDIFTLPMVEIANGIGMLKFNKDGTASYTDYSVKVKTQYGQSKSHIRKIKYDQLSGKLDRKETFDKKYAVIPPYSKITVNALPEPDSNRRYLAKASSTGVEAMVVCNSYIDGKADGKKYEFVLCESDKSKQIDFGTDANELKILQNFKAVYFSKGSRGTDDLGQFWKEQMSTEEGREYGIPVFVKKTNKGNIKSIGLTQIFRIAYNKNIVQAAKQNIDETRLDLPETIFGSKIAKKSLKGRVSFSHFKSKIVRYDKPNKTIEQVLGSPNSSYYPNYIHQTNLNGNAIKRYKTLMDKDVEISGWKRYPLQNVIQHYALPKNDKGKINHEVTTEFIPLEKESVFTGKVRFHNLKKEEIGALISALSFHKSGDDYLHNIGMAKSLGYGKIKIELKDTEVLKYTTEEYLQSFENMMNLWEEKEFVDWEKSPQIVELFSMHNNKQARSLEYQKLENSRGNNDFSEAKKSKKYLLPYSKIGQQKLVINNQKTPNNTAVKPTQIPSKKQIQKGNIPQYTMDTIAKETNKTIQEVIGFAQSSNLGLHNLTPESKINEPQARGLINRIKKEGA